jgi:hypothetical protein
MGASAALDAGQLDDGLIGVKSTARESTRAKLRKTS